MVARQRNRGREVQRADLLRLVSDEGVGLLENGMLFAVLIRNFDRVEVGGSNAETEDVVAVSVDGGSVVTLWQKQVCKRFIRFL